jgi:uncharacterized tellurite resistance protein B-like protein
MEDDFARGELVLAFTWHVVHQIVDADGVVTDDERAFIGRRLPPDELERAAFVGPDGQFTKRFDAALGEALLVLPTLPLEDRTRIVETLYLAAIADEDFERSEEAIVRRSARLLGLRDEDYARILDVLVTAEVALETDETE